MHGLLKEGAIITGVTIGGYMILKYLFKVSPPSAKLNINDAGKLGLRHSQWSRCKVLLQ